MKKIIITSTIFALINHSAIFAQTPGSLDISFDTDGKVVTPIGSADDFGWAVAIQLDGKILVAGSSSNGSTIDFILVRYDTDGSLDNSFDGDGIVTTDFTSSNDDIYSIAIQPDGKIVVAGSSDDGSSYAFALARYNSDGSLDISFDGDGKLTTAFLGVNAASSVVLQLDGKIIAAGASADSADGSGDFALARYNTDGSLDFSFSGDGKLTTDFGGTEDIGYSIVLQSDGKIIVAGGSGYFAPVPVFAIARYNSDGSLDDTFDSDGKQTTDVGLNDDVAYSVALQPDGKIILAGVSYPNVDFSLVRYNINGSLDNTFDGDGKLTTDFASAGDVGQSVIVQSDGKILVAGSSNNGGPSGSDFALACYNSDGSLDTTFSSDGKLTTDFANLEDIGYSMAIQPDGKIVVAGYTFNGTNYDFAVARYISGLNLGVVNFYLDNNSVLIYPNPIAQDSKLEYILTTREEISISLLDISGKMIKTFVNCEKQEPGAHTQMLNFPIDLTPGSYYLIICTPNGKVSVKIIK